MRFHSKLLQRRTAAAKVTLDKVYAVYMTPDGHFAASERENAEDDKSRKVIDRKHEGE